VAGLPLAGAAQSPFSFVKWRSIGPVNTSGRIDDIAVARGDPARGEADEIYVATASGGLWKSMNNGISWSPVFDGVDAMMSIGAVAVAPSARLTVWLGTGEANTRQSSSWGDGVYKSTDGGKTWANMGLKDTRSIARIVIDPTDRTCVRRRAGPPLGPNAERGVFKTTDGGRSWRKVLYVDENTGATDLVIDPVEPAGALRGNVPATAAHLGIQRRRARFGYSQDDRWRRHLDEAHDRPARRRQGRIGLSLYAIDPRVVYATIEARPPGSGIYRTLDAGSDLGEDVVAQHAT
jgi:photosystem II stability/assembly factor-like uncharacterized protein